MIGLPGNLFPTKSILSAILVFDRSCGKSGANEDCKDVLFVGASRGYQPDEKQTALMDERVEEILSAYEKSEEVEKYARLAGCNDMKENDFNLNIPRYIDAFEEGSEIDIGAVQQEIGVLENELAEVRGKTVSLLKEAIA